ncbi:hypothetical protein B0O99DRAFT_721900 [Bisporella sp. PMI_857]|nr:hypothetical protein B0O99DRAFT_721900 [Bisporella sp. PMI_857]
MLDNSVNTFSNTVNMPALKIRVIICFSERYFQAAFVKVFKVILRSRTNVCYGSAHDGAAVIKRRTSEAVNTFGKRAVSWSWIELSKALMLCLAGMPDSVRVFLLIDGLDKYQIFERPDEYYDSGDDSDEADRKAQGHKEPVTLIRQIARHKNVKLCISSRPILRFEEPFSKCPHFKMEDCTFGDISKYVEDQLSGNDRFADSALADPSPLSQLVNDVVKRASGVFLWVRLVGTKALVRSHDLPGV